MSLKRMFDNFRIRFHYGRYDVVKRMIAREGKKLLDIGCGKPCEAMEVCAFLKYNGYGEGLDIRPYNEPGIKTVVGDVHNIPFPDNTFDVVTASEILEHVRDPHASLKEIRRVLKPGGVAVIDTPNNTPIWTVLWFFWEKTVGEMWKDEHVTNLTTKGWADLFSKYMKVEEIYTYKGLLLIAKMRKK